jgi:hypothetical protein
MPDAAREVLAPWINAANRRIEIDRHVAAIRADALAGLSRVSRGAPPATSGATMTRSPSPSSWSRPSRSAVLALTGEPGRAALEWMGWRVEMTAAAAALLTLFSALAFTLLWRGVIWIVEAPRRAARARAEAKRKQAIEALSRGFLAVAAGDGSEARRLAQKSAELAEDAPGLVRVLAAQAAEAAGDMAAIPRAPTTPCSAFPRCAWPACAA